MSEERFIPTHVGNGATQARFDAGHRGSSPRMWGTVVAAKYDRAIGRFIPTHVGNGPEMAAADCRQSVHPHACGERDVVERDRKPDNGSSPRMWGTGPRPYSSGMSCRFIPTHVGNGAPRQPRPCQSSVHPHACGERNDTAVDTFSASGSSPRMWGTGANVPRPRPATRFIPTHVGNGSSVAPRLIPFTVHPHACGERVHRAARRAYQ